MWQVSIETKTSSSSFCVLQENRQFGSKMTDSKYFTTTKKGLLFFISNTTHFFLNCSFYCCFLWILLLAQLWDAKLLRKSHTIKKPYIQSNISMELMDIYYFQNIMKTFINIHTPKLLFNFKCTDVTFVFGTNHFAMKIPIGYRESRLVLKTTISSHMLESPKVI